METKTRPKGIRHLVLSGGGPIIIQTLAVLEHLEQEGFLRMDKIQSIYGTSAGGLAAVFLALRYDWETLRDYLLHRPWKHVFPFKVQTLLDSIANKGMYGEEVVRKCLSPLLAGKQLEDNLTLQQLYEVSGIDIHLFAFELNHCALVDLSHKTHPALPVVTAVHMTCALPLLFQPVFWNANAEDGCYIDGGIRCNYPLAQCVRDHPDEEDAILGFRNTYVNAEGGTRAYAFDRGGNLFDFALNFILRMLLNMNQDATQPQIAHEVVSHVKFLTVQHLKNSIASAETRQEIFQEGIQLAVAFLATYRGRETETEPASLLQDSA